MSYLDAWFFYDKLSIHCRGVKKPTNWETARNKKQSLIKKHWTEREKPKKLTKKPEKSLSSFWFQKAEIVCLGLRLTKS